jgi:drug/metabolite transporter (DMT)-like permease
MERIGATKLSFVTYLIPIVATVLGVLVRHERLSLTAVIGCALIIPGAMATNGLIKPVGLQIVGRLRPRQPASAAS